MCYYVKKNFARENSEFLRHLSDKKVQNLSQSSMSKEESYMNIGIRKENCNHILGDVRYNRSVFDKKEIVLQKKKVVNDISENLGGVENKLRSTVVKVGEKLDTNKYFRQ